MWVRVIQGHWKCRWWMDHMRLTIGLLLFCRSDVFSLHTTGRLCEGNRLSGHWAANSHWSSNTSRSSDFWRCSNQPADDKWHRSCYGRDHFCHSARTVISQHTTSRLHEGNQLCHFQRSSNRPAGRIWTSCYRRSRWVQKDCAYCIHVL